MPVVTIHDEQGRPEPPVDGDELPMALGFLDFLRATMRWKCEDLDADGLRATTASSAMTLGGLLKHLAWVEDHWFSRRLLGRDAAPPWADVDWDADRDWEWNSASSDTPAELLALWDASVERSRAAVTEVAAAGVDRRAQAPWPDGRSPTLRWIVLHMIEEYARHCGHADLLRESVDGRTGE